MSDTKERTYADQNAQGRPTGDNTTAAAQANVYNTINIYPAGGTDGVFVGHSNTEPPNPNTYGASTPRKQITQPDHSHGSTRTKQETPQTPFSTTSAGTPNIPRRDLFRLGAAALAAAALSNADRILPASCGKPVAKEPMKTGYPFEPQLFSENDKSVLLIAGKSGEKFPSNVDGGELINANNVVDVTTAASADGRLERRQHKFEVTFLRPEDVRDLTINSGEYLVAERGKNYVDLNLHTSMLANFDITADSVPSQYIDSGRGPNAKDLVFNLHSKSPKFKDAHIRVIGHGVDVGGQFSDAGVIKRDIAGIRKLNVIDSSGKTIDSIDCEKLPLSRDFKQAIDRARLVDPAADRTDLNHLDIQGIANYRFRAMSQSHGRGGNS